MTDAGKSGYDRDDFDKYALAGFLDKIKSGYVRPGDYLLIENLDRLSRENEVEAFGLFLDILRQDIRIVQLSPYVNEFTRQATMPQLMHAIVELSRGHSESKMKSERGRAAWVAKRSRVREGKAVKMTLPGWLIPGEPGAKPTLDPARVKVVLRIFALARDGYGVSVIARKLNADGVPVFGRTQMPARGQRGIPKAQKTYRTVPWTDSVVYHILTTPAVHGEYQPGTGRGKKYLPSGEPIPNHFPQIITRAEFDAVQAAIADRKRAGRGRPGHHVNLFSGLLVDARDSGTLTYNHIPGRQPVLIPLGAKAGAGGEWHSFPANVFEDCVLAGLAEVTVAAIQGEDDAGRNVAALAGRVEKVKGQLSIWKRKMDDPELDEQTADTITEKLNGLNLTLRGLNEVLSAAQRLASNPVAAAWGETRTIIGLLKGDPSDEMRTKVRAALRRSITEVRCLFTGPHRRLRMAVVCVTFTSGVNRVYFLSHQYRRNLEPITQCVTVPDAMASGDPTTLEPGLLAACERAKESGNTPLGELLGSDLRGVTGVVVLPSPRGLRPA